MMLDYKSYYAIPRSQILPLLSADAQRPGELMKRSLVLFFQQILWPLWRRADYEIQRRKERNYKNLGE